MAGEDQNQKQADKPEKPEIDNAFVSAVLGMVKKKYQPIIIALFVITVGGFIILQSQDYARDKLAAFTYGCIDQRVTARLVDHDRQLKELTNAGDIVSQELRELHDFQIRFETRFPPLQGPPKP